MSNSVSVGRVNRSPGTKVKPEDFGLALADPDSPEAGWASLSAGSERLADSQAGRRRTRPIGLALDARTMRLATIGSIAGLLSGLLGVSGGGVIVPLLVLWLGFGIREATGTSLGAVAVISVAAAALHGAYGSLDPGAAALIGVPAAVGISLGTWLQQRVPSRAVGLIFAVLLALAAIRTAVL